jgi:hypothetical protein
MGVVTYRNTEDGSISLCKPTPTPTPDTIQGKESS